MNFQGRTDLAEECIGEETGRKTIGISEKKYRMGQFLMHRIRIETEEAAERIGKPTGTYLLLDCGHILNLEADGISEAEQILAAELSAMGEQLTKKENLRVLAVGLGNAELTVDSLGPKVLEKVTAVGEENGEGGLFALLPGVYGRTGLDSYEIVRGVADRLHPDLILTVDSLTASHPDRLVSAVQMTDVGIVPGSGVSNRRAAITKATAGVPVLSLGVPTVIDCEAFLQGCADSGQHGNFGKIMWKVPGKRLNFLVAPKEIDLCIEAFSELIGGAVQLAFSNCRFRFPEFKK